MTPSSTRETSQPWCVQMLVNPLNSPAVGWVTTTCSADTTSPPPTGISAVAASGVPPLLVSDGAALGGCAGVPVGVLGLASGEAVSAPAPGLSLPPQAARTPATPTAPAPSSTTRRPSSVDPVGAILLDGSRSVITILSSAASRI